MIRRLAAGTMLAAGSVNLIGVLGAATVFGTFVLSGIAVYVSMRGSSKADHDRINTDKEAYAKQKVDEAQSVWRVREQELLASLSEKERLAVRLQGRVDQLTDQLYGKGS